MKNEKDIGYHKKLGQFQHHKKNSIHSIPCFVSGGIWKVWSITSFWNVDRPSLIG